MSIRVQVGNRIVEFPDGTPEGEMRAALDSLPAEPTPSHETPNSFDADVAKAFGGATGLSADQPIRGRLRQATQFLKQHAPSIAAMGATAAVPALGAFTIPAELAVAGGAGYLGARVRGDERDAAAVEGIKQSGMQGGGRLVQGISRITSRGLMKGGMPKNIKAEYGGNKVADAALETGAIPGSQLSANRISRLSNEANQRTMTVARQMGPLSRREITAGFREPFEEASIAQMPDTAKAIASHARDVGRELKGGISAEGALTRKRILQRQGQAALNNSETSAFMPQLKNTERATITGLLRREPEMAKALDRSQALMGLDDFMKDSLHNNMATRLGGGPMNVVRSPMGLAITAHGVNQGRRIANPQLVRLLDMILGGQ